MSGRQAAAADKGNHVRITLICTSRTAAAAQRDLRQIGGGPHVSREHPAHRVTSMDGDLRLRQTAQGSDSLLDTAIECGDQPE